VRPILALRRYAALIGVVGAVVVIAVTGGLGTLFSSPTVSLGPPSGIVAVGSSWVTGEPSLAASPLFGAIEARAVALAKARWDARQALIAELIAAKKAAAIKARQDLLRKYALERARQLAAYRAELLKIQRERALQAARLKEARQDYQQQLAAYLRARRVTPGQECQDPIVRQYYSCQNGLLPVSPTKPSVKSKGH
jgi:hypothetical protein